MIKIDGFNLRAANPVNFSRFLPMISVNSFEYFFFKLLLVIDKVFGNLGN